jgi:hypothetical protein
MIMCSGSILTRGWARNIRGCGVSFYIWTKKSTQGELDWSSLTGSDYEKLLENLPSKFCFLIHHDTHNHTVKIWSSFLNLYRFVTFEIHEFSNIEDIFEKCILFRTCKASTVVSHLFVFEWWFFLYHHWSFLHPPTET